MYCIKNVIPLWLSETSIQLKILMEVNIDRKLSNVEIGF